MTEKKDWLAIILIGAGSSYARGPDREDTISRCGKIAVSDWSTLYDLAGKETTVNVVDVTGHDEVWWDSRGVWSGDKLIEASVEQVTVTLPKAKRRR